MMSVDENLTCSFQILKPANKFGGSSINGNRSPTPPKDKKFGKSFD